MAIPDLEPKRDDNDNVFKSLFVRLSPETRKAVTIVLAQSTNVDLGDSQRAAKELHRRISIIDFSEEDR